MIHQCGCGFHTDDELWFTSHQARHILRSQEAKSREHDVSQLTRGELERARRDLQVSLALARPGSPSSMPAMARLEAIDAELARRRLSGSPPHRREPAPRLNSP